MTHESRNLTINLHVLTNANIKKIYPNDTTLTFSEVNYFIGKNGSGKTLTLTSLYDHYNQQAADKTKVQMIISTRTKEVTGQSGAIRDKDIAGRLNDSRYSDFYLLLKENPLLKEEVKFWLKKFFNKELQISQQAGNDMIESRDIESTVEAFPLNAEGGGIKNFIALLTYILSPRVEMLFIDEIEEGLNPQIIDFLISKIEETTKIYPNKRFFVLTHSPSAIYLKSNWTYLFFNRNYKKSSDSKVIIFNKFGDTDYKYFTVELDTFRKQTFFSDMVVLVEADTDYYILNALTNKLGYTGYTLSSISYLPVWGAGEMPRYFKFFSEELGKNCICMADKNAEDTLKNIPKDKKFLLKKDDILKYSKAFLDEISKTKDDEQTCYGRLFFNSGGVEIGKKKAIATKDEVQTILISKIEEIVQRYNDVIQIIKVIFGQTGEYEFTIDNLKQFIWDLRHELQKIWKEHDNGNTITPKELTDNCNSVKNGLVDIEKLEGSDLTVIVSFKAEKLRTKFNLSDGNAINDPIEWESCETAAQERPHKGLKEKETKESSIVAVSSQ